MFDSINLGKTKFFQAKDNILLLQKIAKIYKAGKLQVTNSSSSWVFFLEEGCFYYAVSSADSRERFIDKIQILARTNSTIKAKIQQKINNHIFTDVEEEIGSQNYLAICWLVEQQYLSINQAKQIVEELTNEAIYSFLQVREAFLNFSFGSSLHDMPKFYYIDVTHIEEKENKLSTKQFDVKEKLFSNLVTSTSQVSQPIIARAEMEQTRLFADLTKEELTQPELNVEKPSTIQIRNQVWVEELTSSIYQRDKFQPLTKKAQSAPANDSLESPKKGQTKPDTVRKLYKILCIDDSPLILKAIRGYLDAQIFDVVGVDDSLKALVEILRHKPDVILLDISMPNLDGYELCSLLRKHKKFQDTPIIMVTGRRGFIDKARAKLVKASGYLTKPFSKAELLKILFQNLAGLNR